MDRWDRRAFLSADALEKAEALVKEECPTSHRLTGTPSRPQLFDQHGVGKCAVPTEPEGPVSR